MGMDQAVMDVGEAAPKFRDSYIEGLPARGKDGTKRPCYHLPPMKFAAL